MKRLSTKVIPVLEEKLLVYFALFKDAVAERDALRAELDDLKARGVVLDQDCTCGSGGHPRPCDKHPHRMEIHCDELNLINEFESNQTELKIYRAAKPSQDVLGHITSLVKSNILEHGSERSADHKVLNWLKKANETLCEECNGCGWDWYVDPQYGKTDHRQDCRACDGTGINLGAAE